MKNQQKRKKSLLNKFTFGLFGSVALASAVSYSPQGQELTSNVVDNIKTSTSIIYQKNMVEGIIDSIKNYNNGSFYHELNKENREFLKYLEKIFDKKLEKNEIEYIIRSFSELTPEIYKLVPDNNRDLYNRNLQTFYNGHYVSLHNKIQEYLKQMYGTQFDSLNNWMPLTRRNR